MSGANVGGDRAGREHTVAGHHPAGVRLPQDARMVVAEDEDRTVGGDFDVRGVESRLAALLPLASNRLGIVHFHTDPRVGVDADQPSYEPIVVSARGRLTD